MNVYKQQVAVHLNSVTLLMFKQTVLAKVLVMKVHVECIRRTIIGAELKIKTMYVQTVKFMETEIGQRVYQEMDVPRHIHIEQHWTNTFQITTCVFQKKHAMTLMINANMKTTRK